jgi:hypothetical protein
MLKELMKINSSILCVFKNLLSYWQLKPHYILTIICTKNLRKKFMDRSRGVIKISGWDFRFQNNIQTYRKMVSLINEASFYVFKSFV